MRLFFTVDIHASDMCFRKFLNALTIYRIDVGMVLGDLRGKAVVPIVQEGDGSFTSEFLGQRVQTKTERELTDLEKKISSIGFYPFRTTSAHIEELKNSPDHLDKLITNLACERIHSWFRLGEERIDAKTKVYIAAGNDDPFELDEVLEESDKVRNISDRKINLEDHEIVCCSYSNPTPWNTPRECNEDDLSAKIESLASQVGTPEKAIFILHDPPYETILDLAPKLSPDLVPSANETIHVGSIAVLQAIKKYQPMLSMHGHIHESKGIMKIGRTTCINPGSEYSEGVLRGAIVEISESRIKSCMLTSG